MSVTFTVNLPIRQGATLKDTYFWDIDGVPVDMTGVTARMQLRTDYTALVPLVDLTTANGGVVIDAPNGGVTPVIAAAVTSTLTGEGVYDLELYWPDGTTQRFMEGTFTVLPEVTR